MEVLAVGAGALKHRDKRSRHERNQNKGDLVVRFAGGSTGKTASGDARNREGRSKGLKTDAHKSSASKNAPTHTRESGRSTVANKSSNGRSGSFKEKRDAAVLDQNFRMQAEKLRAVKCGCHRRCSPAWSDTAHGSHNFHCKLPYQRFLSLREQFLTPHHGSRPDSGSAWFGAEFFAGILSLTEELQSQGTQMIGCCELNEDLHKYHRLRVPGVHCCGDVRLRGWKVWPALALKAKKKLELLVGGPRCVMFSTAGPKRQERHPDADRAMLTGEAAYSMGCRWVMLENVKELLEDDKKHAVFSSLVSRLKQPEFLNIACDKLKSSQLAGGTKRVRIWPVFEDKQAAAKLPPWDPAIEAKPPNRILSALQSVECFTAADLLVGELVHYEPHRTADGVICVGHFHFGGPDSPVIEGSRVQVWQMPRVTLIVMSIVAGLMELFKDDRQHPKTYTLFQGKPIVASDVVSVEWDSCPVYSIYGTGITIRRFWKPPVGNTFLINDVRIGSKATRFLRGVEAWRLHLLPDAGLRALQGLGVSDRSISEYVGDSIPGEQTRVQVQKLRSRINLNMHIEQLECLTAVPWLSLSAPSVDDVWCSKLLLLLVDASSTEPSFLLDSSTACCVGKCVEAPLVKSAVKIAERWSVTLTCCADVHGFQAADSNIRISTPIVVVPVERSNVNVKHSAWFTASEAADVGERGTADVLAIATARLASFGVEPHALGGLTVCPRKATVKRWGRQAMEHACDGWAEGVVPAMLVDPDLKGSTGHETNWQPQVASMQCHQEALRMHIKAVPPDDPHYDWLQETADCMAPVDAQTFHLLSLRAKQIILIQLCSWSLSQTYMCRLRQNGWSARAKLWYLRHGSNLSDWRI